MIPAIVLIAVVGLIVWSLSGAARGIRADLKRRRIKPGAYEFDSRIDQVYRRMKGVQAPAEDQEAILEFIRSRSGVEAYLEPKTVAHPLSVVLVAHDGEWKRFELAEDSFIRALSKDIGLPTYDAARVGYPQRMRDYKRRPQGETPP